MQFHKYLRATVFAHLIETPSWGKDVNEQLEVTFDLMRGIRYCVNIVSSFPQKSSIPFVPTWTGQPVFIHSSFASVNSPLLTNSSVLHWLADYPEWLQFCWDFGKPLRNNEIALQPFFSCLQQCKNFFFHFICAACNFFFRQVFAGNFFS